MAELTNLESKLGEVIGLAMAAQGATQKVSKLDDLDGETVAGGLAPGGTEVQLSGRWLLNPGSVGQPRDGDPRAAWLLLDLQRRFAAFHRVAYPIEKTQSEMRERRLPPALAARLERGE